MKRGFNRFLLSTMGVILVIWGISHVKTQGGRYGQCVKLPNGIHLGYEARISFGNWNWKPFIVPKFPNGNPVLAGKIWPFRATKTTIYGSFQGRNGKLEEGFLWQKDIGLVFRRDHPNQFDVILSQAGSPIDEKFGQGLDTRLNYKRLAKDPKYGLIDCKTRLFRW